MPYSRILANTASYWPHLAAVPVAIGGAVVAYAEAVAAVEVLAASRTSAIAPVLRAAGSPLAACDYFAAAAPYRTQARTAPKTGRAGAAGRHVTKHAFALAVAAALQAARDAEAAQALAAFAADERYAAALAADAVELRRREHCAQLRRQGEGEVARAAARCALTGISCALETPCGTGACKFAPAWLADVDVPASAGGRVRRPPGHENAGEPFSAAAAIAEAVAAVPFRPLPRVQDSDACRARDRVAAA